MQVYQVIREFVVSLAHQPKKDVQVVNAIEHQDLILGISLGMFQEFVGDLRVVKRRADVMHFVVSIVPAGVIVLGVDAVYGILVRIIGVDEGMLRPISDHHHDARE